MNPFERKSTGVEDFNYGFFSWIDYKMEFNKYLEYFKGKNNNEGKVNSIN